MTEVDDLRCARFRKHLNQAPWQMKDRHAIALAFRKLFKNPCSQAELNKIVPFGFSLQRQKMVFFFAIKIV